MSVNFIKIKDKISSCKGDVFVVQENLTSVRFENDKLNSIDNVEKEGIGVRVIKDGKVGFVSTNDIRDIDNIFSSAEEMSKFGEELDISFPRQPSVVIPIKSYDQSLENVNERDMAELGEEIITSIKEIDPTISVNLNIEKSFIKKTIINSSGLDLSLNKSIWSISIEGVYVGKDESLLWLYDDKHTSRYDIDFSSMISYLRNIYFFAQTNSKVQSGRYPVIFSPSALSPLIYILGVSLNGENVYKGISPLRDKIGEKVASEKFSLIDDPHLEWGIGSQEFDDEGVLTNYKEIISNGILKGFIDDLRTAYLKNTVSTGNGFRSYSSLPKPHFSNIVVPRGDQTLKEIINLVDRGLIVYQILGGGQSNINAGEFSVNIETGFYIENGKVVGRIKDTMLFGNVFDIFKRIIAISKEVKAVGNYFLPYIMFDGINVSAEND
ncbi:MAG: TldD/PmbA family protein [Brevinematales bacterium]|nr:TldD/PmbA family protein [Brevinematales bacterium]